MATESDGVTNNEALQHGLLRHTLASWRFILLFSLPPMAWVLFVAPSGVLRAVIALLCAVVWFGCWRLWLDERYFSLINTQNNEQAGSALCFIWRRERLKTLTLVERQSGALQQCRKTLFLVVVLWAVWLALLV
ncbi:MULTISPECIES: hypothetical protein [Citrobacter]|uniref:hypothetical protein n=1 Tax=Citrobacter TaxID=544 RepID=UPI0002675A98|nr:hypothetical protein [Citrobacter sp. RHBSTW-00271]EIQ75805.1 putative membrane protein [Shigella flexneri 1235-66]MBA7943520.1 hypothetical protein [Citrobacter sp. RHBSTW-00271]